MRRIKFVRQVKLFFDLKDRKDDFKVFEPLIEKLPARNLDEGVLKKEFNKFCQSEYGFSLEESKKLYSQIMSATSITGTAMPGIESSIGLFRKKGGFKTTSSKPIQGGSPGLGKGKS